MEPDVDFGYVPVARRRVMSDFDAFSKPQAPIQPTRRRATTRGPEEAFGMMVATPPSTPTAAQVSPSFEKVAEKSSPPTAADSEDDMLEFDPNVLHPKSLQQQASVLTPHPLPSGSQPVAAAAPAAVSVSPETPTHAPVGDDSFQQAEPSVIGDVSFGALVEPSGSPFTSHPRPLVHRLTLDMTPATPTPMISSSAPTDMPEPSSSPRRLSIRLGETTAAPTAAPLVTSSASPLGSAAAADRLALLQEREASVREREVSLQQREELQSKREVEWIAKLRSEGAALKSREDRLTANEASVGQYAAVARELLGPDGSLTNLQRNSQREAQKLQSYLERLQALILQAKCDAIANTKEKEAVVEPHSDVLERQLHSVGAPSNTTIRDVLFVFLSWTIGLLLGKWFL